MTDLYDMPGHLIRRFQQIAVAIFHSEVAQGGVDITPVQYAALAAVEAHGDVDQATLAGLIAYDRATITGVIDRLVQKGFIERQISPQDRRARTLHLTPAGRQALAQIKPFVEQAQQVMLRGLTTTEAEEFMRLLRKATSEANDLSRAPLRKS